MYVIYYVYSEGTAEAFYSDEPATLITEPSECQWVVPGTIDPRKD